MNMNHEKKVDNSIANSMEDVELSLEQLHFAPGDNTNFQEFAHYARKAIKSKKGKKSSKKDHD